MRVLRQRYSLEREVGRGASGGVWVARDLHLGRHVAVKILHPDQIESAEARKAFEREANILAQLRSPHVVQVFDAGIDDDQPFIVMEFLDGENLEERLRRQGRGPRPLTEVAEILVELARGLSATHRAGLIHRDLKPANVFLAREQGRETLKLVDFGLADEFLPAHRTGRPGFAGTPAYSSPEQLGGQTVDTRADLWALAALAYELLTGRLPFAGTTLLELKNQIESSAFRPPSSLLPELAPTVDAFFARAFARNLTERFASAVALASDFLKLTDGPRLTTHVLVLDDEPDVRLLLEQYFRDERYSFVFVNNGVDGLRELSRQSSFDVVLTDINMPAMDGLSFLARVSEINPHARVVVVSAYSDMLNIRAAMNRGAFDFVCKPYEFADMERTLERAAAAAKSLRRSNRIREERDIMRAVLGPYRVDQMVQDVGISGHISAQAFHATVAAVGVHQYDSAVKDQGAVRVFECLSARLEMVLEEFTRRDAWLVRILGNVTVAVFRGHDALTNAVEACLSARDRLIALDLADGTDPHSTPVLCFGVASGEVIVGGLGSASQHGMEQGMLGLAWEQASMLQRHGAPNEVLVGVDHEAELRGAYAIDSAGASSGTVTRKTAEALRVLGRIPRADASADTVDVRDPTVAILPEAWVAGAVGPSRVPS